MEEPFIVKYKPYYIRDFKLNAAIETTLTTLLEMDELNILIYGINGSGKTMLLEALVREYYCLKKHQAFPEHNILYINHLKEQGINYYRNEMKTFCQSQSIVYGKKKMILIDDLDSINEQSQQVFRNYMDTYRNNIHFVAVCTNIQKIIESIQSRTHIVQLRPLQTHEIREHMEHILLQEKMDIPEPTKQYLLSVCNQSVRVMMNFLEKLQLTRLDITLDVCKQTCTSMSVQYFDDYLDAFLQKDYIRGISLFRELYDSGYSVIDIFDYFFTYLKNTERIDETTKYQIIPYLCKYITIFHTIHEDPIELALFTNSVFQRVAPKAP